MLQYGDVETCRQIISVMFSGLEAKKDTKN